MPVRYGAVPLETGAMRSLRRRREKIIKKGKEKVVYEVVPRYIDLEDGKKYIKNENDELVLYSEER